MTQTMVDQRGKVLTPEDFREGTGLDDGTVLKVETQDDGILIRPIRKSKRSWK